MKMGESGRTIRLGIVGLAGRGLGQMQTLLDMPDVRVAAVCDVYPDRVENATIELETQKKEVGLTRYYYEQDGKTIELHFFDNKLINRVPGWNHQPEQEPKKP